MDTQDIQVLNVPYEFYKMYLFYARELYTKKMVYNEKYMKLLIHIYNKIYDKYIINPDKIFNYYYVERKNKFKKISEKCIDIRNDIIFLHNYYNYYTKDLTTYYKINLDTIKKYYEIFFTTKLTKENFYQNAKLVFKNANIYLKNPKVPIDIKINQKNEENIRKYFGLSVF